MLRSKGFGPRFGLYSRVRSTCPPQCGCVFVEHSAQSDRVSILNAQALDEGQAPLKVWQGIVGPLLIAEETRELEKLPAEKS